MAISRSSVIIPLLMAPTVAVAADIPGDPRTSATLTVGATAASDLGSNRDADWFRTSLQAGRLYAFTVTTGEAGDPALVFRLSARDADGRILAVTDLATRGDWEILQLNFRPKASGTHYLGIRLGHPLPSGWTSALPYQVGLFRDASSSFDDAARLAFNTQVAGTMESTTDSDYYVVRLERGEPIDVLSLIDSFDSIVLFDRDREPLGIVNSQYGKLAYHVPTYTGEHFIRVNRPFSRDFTLKVAPADRGRPTPGDDLLIGTEGADVIDALGGLDLVRGLAGDDVLRGGPGENTIYGGAGDDRLMGAETFDHLFGGMGDDVLIGGPWQDDLHGGRGADRFLFFGDAVRGYDSSSRSNPDPFLQGRDRIYDFADADAIDLRGVDADATRTGRQPFTFVGAAPFTGPGQVGYRFEPDDVLTGEMMTVVTLNTDADAAPEMEIVLGGRRTPQADDFTLRDPPRRR